MIPFLFDHRSLRLLIAHSNNIGDKGATALGKAFETMKHLATIHLQWNRIADKGAQDLCASFKKNSSVSHLQIFDNLFSGKKTMP